MIEKNPVDMAAKLLLIVGGLDAGLSMAGINVLGIIFGSIPLLLSLIYILVGLAALYSLYTIFRK